MTLPQIILSIFAHVLGLGLLANQWKKTRAYTSSNNLRMVVAIQVVMCLGTVSMVTFLYGGDMKLYMREGAIVSQMLQDYGGDAASQVFALLVQNREISRQVPVLIRGGATGSMIAVAGILSFLFGPSLWALALLINHFLVAATLFAYRALADSLPRIYHQGLLFGFCALPSACFWSSGLFKETFATFGMMLCCGCLIFGWRKKKPSFAAGFLVGAYIIGLFKPYILVPLMLSSALYLYGYQSMLKNGKIEIFRSPLRTLVIVGLIVGLVVGAGEIFPQLTVEKVAEDSVNLQEAGARISGGSNYSLTDTKSIADTSSTRIYFFLPLGLLFSLFRPFPTDIKNPIILFNFFEIALLVGLLIGALRANSPRKIFRLVMSSPTLLFCLCFVVVLGSFVGISTSNVGTLSRYRSPMMPFWASMLWVLWLHGKQSQRAS